MARYVYQRSGGPILNWNKSVPFQTRAADAKSLGSLGGATIELPLPRGGAPEPVGGCGCGGGGDVIIDVTSPSFVIGAVVGYFLLGKIFKSS